ncbi:O-antigen ligase family protein [Caballeronia grimmiae]|uniref:O-antigen ligase family protein n=1 Tax=Caballeronia grimmiae TaxID=1071679 RepID=UPI0038B7132A
MVYITLLALLLTVTNFVPLSAIGFLPVVLCSWRFFGRTYPAFVTPLVVFGLYVTVSTLLYAPASFTEFDFYRRDGNFYISYLPFLAGFLYTHDLDLNKLLRRFFIFAIVINAPFYAYYLAHTGLLSILKHPSESYGSYFIARNAAGGFLSMLCCLGIACYMHRPSKFLLGCICLNVLMLWSTYSRGSLLGLVMVIPYVVLGRKRWVLATLIAGMLVSSIALAQYFTLPHVDYMGYTFAISDANEKTANVSIRFEWLWPRALDYFKQSPIVGMGFGSFDDQIGTNVNYFGLFSQPLRVAITHSDSHAHNSYLNLLAELGVVGLALMLAFYWRLITWCQKGANDAIASHGGRNFVAFRYVELSSICLLVMSATEHRMVSPSNVLILALGLSLLVSSRAPAPRPTYAQTGTRFTTAPRSEQRELSAR